MKSSKYTVKLLIISYVIAVFCFILSSGMIHSVSIEEGVDAVVFHKDLFMYPIVVFSYVTVVVGVILGFLGFIHKNSRRQKVLCSRRLR